MNFNLQNLELPMDNLSSQIGVSVNSDFEGIQNGGNHNVALAQQARWPNPVSQSPDVNKIAITDWNQMMPAYMNVLQQDVQNKIIQSLTGAKAGAVCTNKNLKAYKAGVDGLKDDTKGTEAEKLQTMFSNAMLQNMGMPQIGSDGNAMLPIQAMLQQAYFNAMIQAQQGLNMNGGALPVGEVMAHNFAMNNNLSQPVMGMSQPGLALGANDVRSMVSGVMGNSNGQRMVPSSLSSVSSAHTSFSLPGMPVGNNCAQNTGARQCRKPNCFRPMPGVVGSDCLPRKGVSQMNGMCPPQYNRGRNGSCVPKPAKQLRRMNRASSSSGSSSMSSSVSSAPRRGRGRGAKSMCAQVNQGAKQAQNNFVMANCNAPGCTVKKMRNGNLQCAKARN
tara:strand:- start:972 stop:2138 length:1167 start_codon:yes stop_codon:yes gene_type:complete